MNFSTIRILFLIGLFAIGCSPKTTQSVTHFSLATLRLGDDVNEGLDYVNTTFADYYKRKVVSGDVSSSFYTLFTENPDTFFQEAINDETLKKKIALINHLQDYAQELLTLSTTNFKGDIDEATTNFRGSIKGLVDRYNSIPGTNAIEIPENELTLFSDLVGLIGERIVERKRRKAIKQAVLTADEAVEITTTLLQSSLGEHSFAVKTLLLDSRYELIEEYKRTQSHLPIQDREALFKNIHDIHEEYVQVDDFFRNIEKNCKKVGETHKELKKITQQKKWNSAKMNELLADLTLLNQSIETFFKN